MDFIEFNKDATKLLRDVQCLQIKMCVLTEKKTVKEQCMMKYYKRAAGHTRVSKTQHQEK